ncbi:Berberine bridge enzyme-like 24 [Linum perenne]
MLKILSILLFIVTVSADQISHGDSDSDSILDCLHSTGVSQFTHLPTDSTYTAVLQSSIKNSRFNTTAASKPSIIVTPETVSHIQSTILCSKNHNFHLRIRSGGHDSEGLSYLVRFRNITIDDDSSEQTAWVQAASCIEMSWARSILYFGGFPPEFPLESLLDRTISATGSAKFKGKSDYVKDPIPISGLEGIWEKLKEVDPQTGGLIMASYGGRMSEIPESSIPFPHRGGIIYQVEEVTFWVEDGEEAADRQINWLRGLYDYMAPYVSKNPREAYVNYRDLDIGSNAAVAAGDGGSYRRAKRWGSRYFKNNFDRLVRVKTAVDPSDFFRNEQSIPPLFSLQ